MHVISGNIERVVALCKTYNVKALYVFGSVLRNDFCEDSDIDLAVAFDRNGIAGSFDQYFDFKLALESLFGRSVDLICIQGIRNEIFRRELEDTRELIYAA